jgi:hypothetical protein
MTFGGGTLQQNIPVAWQNRSQQRIAVTVTISWLLICRTPQFTKNRLVRLFSVYAHPHQMSSQPGLTSPVASRLAKKPGKLPVLTNVKCCFCLFYKFSQLSDNNNKMHNYNSNVQNS